MQMPQGARRDLRFAIGSVAVAVDASVVEENPVIRPQALRGLDHPGMTDPSVGQPEDRSGWLSDGAGDPIRPEGREIGILHEDTVADAERRCAAHANSG